MGLLRRPLPDGLVALPPSEWGRSGLYLGMDQASKWLLDGMPEDLRRWHLDAILGGQRCVNGIDVSEATALMLGGPGAHKSLGWLLGLLGLQDWPGPVLCLSTRTDLARFAGPRRQRLGKVQVLDWRGSLAATLPYERVRWNPLDGCENAGVAKDRMTSMMETALMGGAKGDPFWEKNGVAIVAAYAHSAALKGVGVEQVLDWLDRDELKEPGRVIKAHGSRARMGARLATFDGKAEETREGVLHMARLVFEAGEDPAVLDGCTPSLFGPAFDIDAFLDSMGTLFVLDKGGKATISTLAPLTVALVNAILEKAEAKAAATPEGPGHLPGRLAKPLLVVIDEVANISPLPNLVQVFSQARGHGIAVAVAAQSWNQLTERWGPEGASAIWDTAAYRLVGAGLQDQDGFLTSVSKSLGEKYAWRESVGSQSGGGAARRSKSESFTLMETPNYKMSALSQLPEGEAILIGREGVRLVHLPALPSLLEAMERAAQVADELEWMASVGYSDPRHRLSRWSRLLRSVGMREV